MTENHTAAVPSGCVAYAVGDIHGRADLLNRLLEQVVTDAAALAGHRRVLVFLGDYIDRGPDSRGVIERLSAGLPEGFETHCMKGNHEALMLGFLERPEELELWLHNGAGATLESYGLESGVFSSGVSGAAACRDALLRHLPSHHLAFLNALAPALMLGDYFFVHAGVRPGRPLDRQQEDDLFWIRGEFLESSEDFGKVVVHGHTPVREPDVRNNRINIDTGAWMRGTLTALRLEGATRRFLTTAQD